MKKDFEKFLDDFQPKHSDFQIENFIVGNEPDNWAKYKQAISEIAARVYDLEIQKENLELHKLNRPGPRFFLFTKRRRKKRKINEARHCRITREMETSILATERELKKLRELAVELKKQFEDLTPERRAELEARSWFNKARKLVLIDSICNGGQPSRGSLEFILSLPLEMQNKILINFNREKLRAVGGDGRQNT